MNAFEQEKAAIISRIADWEDEKKTNKYGCAHSANSTIKRLKERLDRVEMHIRDIEKEEKTQSGVHPIVDAEKL